MGRLPYITDIYNIYNIYPFLKMPADPVFMRVSGKPQSGNFSNLGWQFLELVENSNNCDINCTKILQTVIGFLFFGVQD